MLKDYEEAEEKANTLNLSPMTYRLYPEKVGGAGRD